MKFELKPYHRDVSDQEFLDDLIKVAKKLKDEAVSMRGYDQKGKFHSVTIAKRFGGWNKALEKAGLEISVKQNITEKELFDNLEEVWIKLGHQPGRRDMIRPVSKFSEHPYVNKYGSWRKALKAFVEYINADTKQKQKIENEDNDSNSIDNRKTVFKHKTKRDISSRLKVQVLIRDGNKCKLCGVTVTGKNIHFDHKTPWSKGGETVLENIQVLCAEHNLAKGDYYSEE